MSTHLNCKHPGCDKLAAVAGYCNVHFRGVYGITAEQYRAEKRERREDPETVAARVREYSLAASKARVDKARETFHAALEEEKEKHPAKPPTPPVTGIPTTGKDEETQLEFEAPAQGHGSRQGGEGMKWLWCGLVCAVSFGVSRYLYDGASEFWQPLVMFWAGMAIVALIAHLIDSNGCNGRWM